MLRTSAKGPAFGGAVIGLETKTSVEDRGIPHSRGRGAGDRGIPRGRGRGISDRGISRGRGRGGDDHGVFRGSSRGRGEGDHEGSRGGGRGRGMLGRGGFEGGRGRGMGDRGGFDGGRGRGMGYRGGIEGGRGRGMGDRGGGRGRGMGDRGALGGGRGRGVEVQKGFRGSSRGQSVANRGDRGGFRGLNGSVRGIDRGGSCRGRAVVIRGDRGGFRGSRGSFRGSDRGSHENGFGGGVRGSWAHSDSRGRGGSFVRGRGRGYVTPVDQKQVPHQIKLSLQLQVIFKETPVDVEELKKLPGFHSVITPQSHKECKKIILFKHIASCEAAKAILDAQQNVQTIKQKSVTSICTMNSSPHATQVYLGFSEAVDEVAVDKLVGGIKKVEILTEKNSCALQYATPEQALIAVKKLKCESKKIKAEILNIEQYGSKDFLELTGRVPDDPVIMSQVYMRFKKAFDLDTIRDIENIAGKTEAAPLFGCTVQFATREEAVDAGRKLKSRIGVNALRLVSLNWQSLIKGFTKVAVEKIILRDVPENVTIKDFVTEFPKAISVFIYRRTFPASEFCHAIVGFEKQKDANEFLKLTDLKIAGRKVFIFPAYDSLMKYLHKLGNLKKKKAVKDVEAEEEPPSKKRKMKKGCETVMDENVENEGIKDEDAEDEGVEDEDAEDEGVEDENAEYEDAECEEVEDENAECEEVEDENAECEEVEDEGEED